MRIAHLSDLHLGFRAYARTNASGVNQREADIAATFGRVVDQIIALAPDLIVIGGDVFHTVRPTNTAVVHAVKHFHRLRAALPTVPVVIASGNHDTPRTVETGSILPVFAQSPLDFHIAYRTAQRFRFPALGCSVLAVPDTGATRPEIEPDPEAAINVLLMHGELAGVIPGVSVDQKMREIPLEELQAERFAYVALGHYHVVRECAPRVWYSGSIDYTSSNIWGERAEETAAGCAGKGFLLHDTETGETVFHHVPTARPVLDLATISAAGLTPEKVDAAIRDAVEAAGIDDAIVRLRVTDCAPGLTRALDAEALRRYKRRALFFHLLTTRATASHAGTRALTTPTGRRKSLSELFVEYIGNAERSLPADVDRAALAEAGQRYLADVDEATPMTVAEAEHVA